MFFIYILAVPLLPRSLPTVLHPVPPHFFLWDDALQHQTSSFPGTLKYSYIFCHWNKTMQSSVGGTSDQPVNAGCLVAQFLGAPGIWISWDCWCSYRVALPFSFNPVIGYYYLHLSQKVAGRVFQRTATLSSWL